MKKIMLILSLTFLLISCTFASSDVEINNVTFNIPSKYQGGELSNDEYEIDNNFSLRRVDDNIVKAIGFWACEKDFSEDLIIDGHPVRHFCQYSEYVHANQSHAYFASGESIYEIKWLGKEINTDIKNLIKNSPKSEINADAFYKTLNESIEIYKQQRIDKLNHEAEYNYLEAKYKSQNQQEKSDDDGKIREILLTYYR